ncbi:nitrous oxide reductase accessory protein NosL [Kurthia sibirica]|uniref:nitrous oxide reductase accessory protein NosL n=1 Tax=Kurthia sibirica TaxID=202750 RepID=UPI001171767E|nr:nitrous oxide reductase accessory protein NosL [Kurthia sibirica]GEK33539.1 hypothetical protein KSI01_10720 [Kurthia sibirica]
MKTYQIGLSALLIASLLAACGNDKEATNNNTSSKTEQADKSAAVATNLKEPAANEVCAFCNMEVYKKSDQQGAFTAQAIDDQGKNLFFDDSGCMLNYEKKHKVTLDKYVRNYDDKDWLKLDQAVVVKGDMKTPMKYGFAFFKDDKAANAFIEKNPEAKIVTVHDIDDLAHKKMDMMSGSHDDDKDSDHDGH